MGIAAGNAEHRKFPGGTAANKCKAHAEVKPRAGQRPMSEVKMLKSDPVAAQAQSEEIKAHYAKVFRV
jgi:hypothetical protein